jgi:hypothetical protein
MTKTLENPKLNVTNITIRRILWNVIEYTMNSETIRGYDMGGNPIVTNDETVMHANREATFFGPHTGSGNAHQVHGGASTLWREDDNQMLMAFHERYPLAEVSIA